jgi:hypothetical protein
VTAPPQRARNTGPESGGNPGLQRQREVGPTSGFGVLAPLLAAIGHEPVPIRPGTKAPEGLPDWTAGQPPAHYLPRCADWGTGVLCRATPGVDIDIRDARLVKILVRMIDAMVDGELAPIRIGQPPKALLAFHASEPFAKLATPWFALPGEVWTAPGYKPNRVEVLGDGQQFVACARHPDTRRPYRWARGDLLSQYAVDLPALDPALAGRFVTAAELVLRAAGLVELERLAGSWRPVGRAPAPPPARPRAAASERGRSAWTTMAAEKAAPLVDRNARRTRRGWLVRCPAHQDANASLSLADGDRGLMWHCFGGCTSRAVARALEELLS